MEHHHVRYSPPDLKVFSCDTRYPVVAVDNVVMQIMLFAEIFNPAGKVWSMIVYQELIDIRRFSCLNMDLAVIGC